MNCSNALEEIVDIKSQGQEEIKIVPRIEHCELNKKKTTLKNEKISQPDKLSQKQIIQAKLIKLEPTEENKMCLSQAKNAESKINIKSQKKEVFIDINLLNLSEDEKEEKPMDSKCKSRDESHIKKSKKMNLFQFCGKKRKNTKKRKERIKTESPKKASNNNNLVKYKQKLRNTNLGKKIINIIDDNDNDGGKKIINIIDDNNNDGVNKYN